MSDYEIWIDTDTGSRQRVLFDVLSFEYVKTVNSPGYFSARLPKDFDRDLLKRDNLVEIWRRYPGGSLYLDWVGFLRRIRYTEDEVTISGPDMLDLLRRRIVDYPAGNANATYTNEADDIIKDLVRYNMGASATDATRNLTSAGLSVAADTGQGASIIKSCAWRNVLTVCQETAEASRQAGEMIYFDIVPTVTTSGLTYTLQTFIGQRGSDRSGSTLVGYEIGNLAEPVLEYDYGSEATYVKAAGQGEEADRMTATSSDSERLGASVWNRCEVFADGRHITTSAALTDYADKRLSEGRPRVIFTGVLLEAPGLRYGKDWEYGDRLSVSAFGQQFEATIKSVRVSVTQTGNETITAKLEAEL